MTVEEIEIIVTAKVEEALKEFEKIVPAIKEKMQQVQESFSKVNTNVMTNKVSQAINFMKKKIQDFKKSSENNQVSIKINNKEAQKQISQIQKQIDSLHEKINARQMKLNVINPQIDKIVGDTRKNVTPEGINPNDKAMDTTINNALNGNKDFTSLNSQAQKLYTEIEMYNKQLSEAKNKMTQLNQATNKTASTQNKLGSFFGAFKQKIEQVKPSISGVKNIFSKMPNIGQNLSKATQSVTNNIKEMRAGFKNGLGQVLKYAGALFSLRSIYSALSSSANAWLSSQNSQAKQLSANINYMKYAMGSTLAPVIQYVTGLAYQLMKAIQSVAYALTGVNIFAKASASSYASMASSAKNAKNETKQLAGIHNEINNIQSNNGSNGSGGDSTAPSFDLSGINDTSNTIIDAIKSGNWYEVGKTIGKKINEAMNSIPWDKIQNTARNLGTDIAKLLNGFIGKTDWKQVGNTVAQGINTAVYFTQSFVHTFNWSGVGSAVANTINGFFSNTDWGALGDTISTGIKGALDGVTAFFKDFDWSAILDGLMDFIKNFDWNGVADAIFKALGSACASCVKLGTVIGKYIKEGFKNISQYFQDEIEECGGNVVLGILKGIGDAVIGIGQWIYDHIFKPFIDGFKDVFGIHSPSTVMAEMGRYLVEGLKNGISDLWNRVKAPFEEFGNNVSNKFNEIKNKINDWADNTKTIVSNWGSNIRSKISECWTNASNTVKDKVNFLKTNISTGLNNTKSTVSNWGDNIKNTFTNLGRNASSWGRDLAENMASGIRNNIYRITNAVNSVANKIKSFLHFTEPDEGPLSNFHTYMPDMVELMANGIRSNTGKIKSEMENLASMMSYTINTDSITSHNQIQPKINPINIQPSNVANRFEDVLSDLSSFNNSDRPIKIIINIGNKKIGEIALDDLRDRTRRTGKDIEALIGG